MKQPVHSRFQRAIVTAIGMAALAGASWIQAQTTSGADAAPVRIAQAASTAVSAPPPAPPARGPALALALEAARTAIETCTARDQKIGVTVLDSAGVVKVVLGMDGASARGVQSSSTKAQTALAFKTATSQLAEQANSDKALADRIAANPAYNSRAGGLLVKVGNDVIGAIGVGGARGSEVDEACATAGLQKVQSRLQ